MNDMTTIKLSAEGRVRLRKAITAHAGWKDHRKTHSLAIETMSAQDLLATASALGLDIEKTTAAGGEMQHKPRPFTPEHILPLCDRIEKVATLMSQNDAAFCTGVMRTINDKQDGAATENQYNSLNRVVTKYETESQDSAKEAAKPAEAEKPKPKEPAAMSAHVKEAEFKCVPINDPAAQLAALIGQLAGQSLDAESIARIVDERIAKALESVPTIRIEVKGRDGETRAVEGHQHPRFKDLLRAASARMANGYAPNIWLAGPAGSGKTHAGHQLSQALGLAFHLNGALSMPHELLGFIDAGGSYHRTPFREAYEHGGVYMFDEVDGSDNSALLALNAALANGSATFPDAKITRHPDCVILASANTWGLGATAEYVGRAKIDAAFLSRFPVRIAWDYDAALEVAISGNERFARRVIAARERARAAGLKVLIDPRASQAGAALIAAGMTEDEAASLTYLANVSKDQRKMLEG